MWVIHRNDILLHQRKIRCFSLELKYKHNSYVHAFFYPLVIEFIILLKIATRPRTKTRDKIVFFLSKVDAFFAG
jgi:hypothetical protein